MSKTPVSSSSNWGWITMQIFGYDILKKDSAGAPIWLEAVRDLDTAKKRVAELAANSCNSALRSASVAHSPKGTPQFEHTFKIIMVFSSRAGELHSLHKSRMRPLASFTPMSWS